MHANIHKPMQYLWNIFRKIIKNYLMLIKYRYPFIILITFEYSNQQLYKWNDKDISHWNSYHAGGACAGPLNPFPNGITCQSFNLPSGRKSKFFIPIFSQGAVQIKLIPGWKLSCVLCHKMLQLSTSSGVPLDLTVYPFFYPQKLATGSSHLSHELKQRVYYRREKTLLPTITRVQWVFFSFSPAALCFSN